MRGRYFLKLNGERLPEAVAVLNNYFEYESNDELIDRLVLRFKSADGEMLDRYFSQGDEIEFTFGQAEDAMSEPRTFTVRRVEGVYDVTVTAYERIHAIMQHSRSKVYRNITLDELAAQKARENGLRFQGDSFPLRYTQIAQVNETDLRLLQRRAKRQNADIYREGQTLFLVRRTFDGSPAAEFVIDPNGGFSKGKALDFRPTESGMGIPWEVTYAGMDPLTLKQFEARANDGNVRRTVLGQETIIFDSAAGQAARPGQTGVRIYTPTASPIQAREEAAAMYEAQEANQVTATATLWGDPDVLANRIIRMTGSIERWAGLYRVAKARHIIAGEYKIMATIGRNATGSAAGGRKTGGTPVK